MKLINNTTDLLGDDIKAQLKSESKLKIAASCFSIYAYEALKKEFANVDTLEFIFTDEASIWETVQAMLFASPQVLNYCWRQYRRRP